VLRRIRDFFPERVRRIAIVSVVVVLGAWLGLLAGGHVQAPVGPVETRMSVRPAWTGDTVVRLAPLGTLRLDSHDGPLQVVVDVQQLNVADTRRIFANPASLRGLDARLIEDIRDGTRRLAIRSILAAAAGATVLGALVFRSRLRRAAVSGGLAFAVTASGVAAAGLTLNPQSLAEPRYTGLLTSAPTVVGDARNIVGRFTDYSEELAALVTNVSRLYDVTSTLPAYTPDPTTIRLLHVADLHLNPAAWEVIRSVTHQYDIDVIVDSGDIVDHGSGPENRYVEGIATLGVPYVYVRGNHDSQATERAVRRQRGAVVLTGKPVDVGGLRLLGDGDPRFTPDRAVEAPSDDRVREMGSRLAFEARASQQPVDFAVVHDPTAAEPLDGTVPLILAGHTHRRSTKLLEGGTRLFVQGSTGGAGLRALEPSEPTPVQCSVLYIDRSTKKLQAWDDISLGGLGLASASVSRHLAQPPAEQAPPTQAPSPAADR
jgi:predicted MPP superfamily phosphohydrolase